MKFIPALVALSLLSACAGKGTYPSLNPRPIEAQADALLAEPSRTPPAPTLSDPAIAQQIAAAMRQAADSMAAFDVAIAKAQKLVDQAGISGSESWIAAQMEVSAAERARAPVKMALSDLDTLRRTLLATPAGEDLAATGAALSRVEAEDARQARAIAALQAALTR
jgi:hypothetical protein